MVSYAGRRRPRRIDRCTNTQLWPAPTNAQPPFAFYFALSRSRRRRSRPPGISDPERRAAGRRPVVQAKACCRRDRSALLFQLSRRPGGHAGPGRCLSYSGTRIVVVANPLLGSSSNGQQQAHRSILKDGARPSVFACCRSAFRRLRSLVVTPPKASCLSAHWAEPGGGPRTGVSVRGIDRIANRIASHRIEPGARSHLPT